jgi:hypothetical protein
MYIPISTLLALVSNPFQPYSILEDSKTKLPHLSKTCISELVIPFPLAKKISFSPSPLGVNEFGIKKVYSG